MIPDRLLLKLREAAKGNGYIHAARGTGARDSAVFIYGTGDKPLLSARSLAQPAYDAVLNWWAQYGTTPLADQINERAKRPVRKKAAA